MGEGRSGSNARAFVNWRFLTFELNKPIFKIVKSSCCIPKKPNSFPFSPSGGSITSSTCPIACFCGCREHEICGDDGRCYCPDGSLVLPIVDADTVLVGKNQTCPPKPLEEMEEIAASTVNLERTFTKLSKSEIGMGLRWHSAYSTRKPFELVMFKNEMLGKNFYGRLWVD